MTEASAPPAPGAPAPAPGASAPAPGASAPVPGASAPAAGAAEFLEAFDGLAQAIRRARGASARQEGDEQLTFSQFALLAPLASAGAARVSDLAAGAGVSPSTATRILDALERRAIVRRTRSPEDRRGVTVTLTDDGRRALDRQVTWMIGRRLTFYEQLPEIEQELVSDLLVRLAALIDELAAGPAA